MLWPLLVAMVTGVVAVGALLKSRFGYESLPALEPASDSAGDDVTVIIPARNEQGVVGPCVRALAGLDVVVANDHSRDHTRAEAEEAGARVVDAPPLPRYWMGKANACWSAAHDAAGTWLLFADADTRFQPGFVSSLLQYARRTELIGASVFVHQQLNGFLARTVVPYAMGLYFTGISASEVNHPLRAAALARGECFLIRRDAYQFLQGHRAVASQKLDDLALARLMKRHRMKIHVLRDEEKAQVRMRDVARTFLRITLPMVRLYPGSVWPAIATGACLCLWAPVALWLILAGLWEVAAVYSLIPVLAWSPWYGWANSWRAPLAIYLVLILLLWSAGRSLLGLTTDWKGRPV